MAPGKHDEAVMKTKSAPVMVAIVGGSGAGKSWLAAQLQAMLGRQTARISLDDFYRDRSFLPPERRARINYDHPRAIDWRRLQQTLDECLKGCASQIPQYDFKNHSRRAKTRKLAPKALILMDGLWLLHRPRLRRIFDLSIFIRCPAKTRLNRRLARDLKSRGRTRDSIQRQFLETVEPMHQQHVMPQAGLAEIQLNTPVSIREVRQIAALLAAKMRE